MNDIQVQPIRKSNSFWNGEITFSQSIPKEQLLLQYVGLVKYVLQSLHITDKRILSKDDLLHYGILGLNEAIEHFDSSKLVKFETYAVTRIRGTILDALRKADWIPRSVRSKMKQNEIELNEECVNGNEYLREFIALRISVPVNQYEHLYEEAQHASNSNIDGNSFFEQDFSKSIEQVIDLSTEDPYEKFDEEEIKKSLTETIEKLPQKQQLVIALYYYEELSLAEISEALSISVSRVSQLHREAVKLLKKKITFN